MHQPYTYLIAWTHLNVFYYGVRYSKKIKDKTPEQDLWVHYFTSSKYVHKFREIYGEPDRIEVRKVFDSAEAALKWEEKFLKKVKVIEKLNWLNKSYTNGEWFCPHYEITEEHRRKLSKSAKGRRLSPKSKLKISNSLKGRKHSEESKIKMSKSRTGKIPWNKGKKLSDDHKKSVSDSLRGRTRNSLSQETKNKISESLKGKKMSPEVRKKLSVARKGKRWYTNGQNTIKLNPDIDRIPNGYRPGRK